jgi:hypothetical protein
MKALASIVLVASAALATAACSLVWQPADIKPNDAVKTSEQAIALTMHGCGAVVPDADPDHWDAHLEADIWHVNWSHRMSSASALIEKGDGTFDDCDVSLAPE